MYKRQVTDNGNGSYTATVTAPSVVGTGVFVATLNGAPVQSGTASQTQTTLTYAVGAISATGSTLTPTSATLTANGTSTQVLTVTARDANGNALTTGGATVTITRLSGTGTISAVTDNGNGTYTATVTAPSVVGNGVFVATLGGAPVQSGTASQTQAALIYAAEAASASISTLTPTTTILIANGSNMQVLTVTARDATGNALPTGGATVTITRLSGTGTISAVTDNGNGTYTATVTAPSVVGSGVFVATLGGAPVQNGTASQTQAAITYAVGPASASMSTLTPTSTTLTANGTSTQLLTVTARDASGNALSSGGATVTITRLSGTGTIGAVTDVGNGTYTATVTAPSAVGSGVFVATLGGSPVQNGGASQSQGTVTYAVGAVSAVASTLTPTSATLNANGTSTQLLTVTARDASGNALSSGGATVTITRFSGTGTIGAVTDVGNGTYTALVTAPSTAGSGVFVATLGGSPVQNGGASQTQVTVAYAVGAVSAATSVFTPAAATLIADGTSTQLLTVTARDANGNVLTTGGATVTITRLTGTGSISAVTDNGNGTYTATVTAPTRVGSGVFAATINGARVQNGAPIQTQVTVTYIAGPLNASASTFIMTSASMIADGDSTVQLIVTARDQFGNPRTSGGNTVRITRLSGEGTIGPVGDRGNGTYSATLTAPTRVGIGVFQATIDGAPVQGGTDTPTQVRVAYAVGPSNASASLLTPSDATLTADGTSTQLLTVTVRDAGGNAVTTGGARVTISRRSGTGSISAVTDVGNGTYTATVTAPRVAGRGVFVATVDDAPVGNGTGRQTEATISYLAVAASAVTSTLTPSRATLTADGTSTQRLLVTTRDLHGNTLTTGGATVAITLSSGTGMIGPVTDHGDGTYSATVTAPTRTGSGVFAATLNGAAVQSGTEVPSVSMLSYVAGVANAWTSTLTPDSATLPADGTSPLLLRVSAKDVHGNPLTTGGASVTITRLSGNGTIGGVTDHGNGTYTAIVTAPSLPGNGTFVATLGGLPVLSGTGSQTLATLTYAPLAPTLEIAVTVDRARPNVGDTLTVVMTVTNTGTRTASDAQVASSIPMARFHRVSLVVSQGTFLEATQQWRIGALAPRASATLTFRGVVRIPPTP